MRSKLGVLVLLASVAPAFAGATAPDFDNGVEIASILKEARAKAKEFAALKAQGVKTKGGSLWVSLGGSDMGALTASDFPLGAPVAKSNRASVFELPAELLPLLSQFMHEKFNRCAGYFAHATRSQAEAD